MSRKSPRGGEPISSAETISRRSVVDWLGKAAVLALGAELAAACAALVDGDGDAGSDAGGGKTGDAGRDAGPDAGGDAGSSPVCASDDFPFAPGSELHPAYTGWGERTVDPQDLLGILAAFRLRVDGLVQPPLDLGFHDILALERQDQVTDFHCVEGWSIRDVPWNGVHLSRLFELGAPLSTATHVTFHSAGGIYRESLPLDVALEPRSLLAYGIDCATLPLKHGFPLRMVVPRKWGYKNPKYVWRVELTDQPIEGFWEQYGYPYDGDVPESRLREGRY